MKNFVIALSIFAFTAPGFAEENSSSIELSAKHGGSGHGGHGGHHGGSGHGGHGGHPHGGSGHHHGGSGHGGHGHHGRSHHHRTARSHYHHGRFDNHYFHSHFGPGNLIIWGGPGFWYGAPWLSPFWFGGVYWGFGPGFVFLPEWQVAGWYVASVATGYVLLNATFPSVQVPVVVQINLAPPDDEE